MEWQDLVKVFLTSVASLVVLFAATKLMGNRQMSQLTLFDYIIGISIGSIAAEMASHPDDDSWLAIVAMAVYAGAAILISVANDRSRKIRKFVVGEPLILYDRGTLYYNNFKKAKLDLTEFMTECRAAGYFDLTQLQMILMEINGKLSFLPNETSRPLTPGDMRIDTPQSRPAIAVIMDGVLLKQRLQATGNTESWLQKQMDVQGFQSIEDIMLATVDANNALSIYEKNEDRESKAYYS